MPPHSRTQAAAAEAADPKLEALKNAARKLFGEWQPNTHKDIIAKQQARGREEEGESVYNQINSVT